MEFHNKINVNYLFNYVNTSVSNLSKTVYSQLSKGERCKNKEEKHNSSFRYDRETTATLYKLGNVQIVSDLQIMSKTLQLTEREC